MLVLVLLRANLFVITHAQKSIVISHCVQLELRRLQAVSYRSAG